LKNAPDDILSDIPLIEGLEATKAASIEINAAVAKGMETEIAINIAREVYRRVAAEGLVSVVSHFSCVQSHLSFLEHRPHGKRTTDNGKRKTETAVPGRFHAVLHAHANEHLHAHVPVLARQLRHVFLQRHRQNTEGPDPKPSTLKRKTLNPHLSTLNPQP
jgi:hypothetical protein